MDTSPVKLHIHEHPLIPSARIVNRRCGACCVERISYGGYVCSDSYCNLWFHKECAEAKPEINHRYRPNHPLLLTDHVQTDKRRCDLCGRDDLTSYYRCPKSGFIVDLNCVTPPTPAIENPVVHDHRLVFLKKKKKKQTEHYCEVCDYFIGGPSYSCLECDVHVHVECTNLSKEINFPCHSNHSLKFISFESLKDDADDADKNCHLCGEEQTDMLYHCSICNFTLCIECSNNPPPLVIDHTKTHEHQLTLFPKKISFICNVCGLSGDLMPYICVLCGFAVHGKCIDLPRVININRHEYRVSFTHHRRYRDMKCKICRKSVSPYYGAYSCSRNPYDYAFHSLCATRKDVWDGVELEGVPELTEDIKLFIVLGNGTIRHDIHREHRLKHQRANSIRDQCMRCELCFQPIGFDQIWSCQACVFALHMRCTLLHKKKRLVFHTRRFTLDIQGTDPRSLVHCGICGIYNAGFRYVSERGDEVDLHCSSISEALVHDCHLHPLYFDKKKEEEEKHNCNGCRGEAIEYMLRCEACDFDLCYSCASLPDKIHHSNDEHPLTLCCGEKESGKLYWCDICEKELDSSKWFYTCLDCGVTLHVQCVVGDFWRLRPGYIIEKSKDIVFEVVANNHNTRPKCCQCNSRCHASIILKDIEGDSGYLCSRNCFTRCLKRK